MTVYPIIKLKYPFSIVKVGGVKQAVPTKEGARAFHGVIRLVNDPAEFMFSKLIEGITLPDLIMACMKRYDASGVEEVGPKVIAFLDQLKEKNLLSIDPTRGIKYDEN